MMHFKTIKIYLKILLKKNLHLQLRPFQDNQVYKKSFPRYIELKKTKNKDPQ